MSLLKKIQKYFSPKKDKVLTENHGNYDALDVAHYIIKYSLGEGIIRHLISPLQLQCLLYLCQAYFLTSPESDYSPCFKDQIEATKYGARIKSIQSEYSWCGGCTIPYSPNRHIWIGGEKMWESIPYDEYIISSSDREILNRIVDYYGNMSITNLIKKVKDKAWEKIYKEDENCFYRLQDIQKTYMS